MRSDEAGNVACNVALEPLLRFYVAAYKRGEMAHKVVAEFFRLSSLSFCRRPGRKIHNRTLKGFDIETRRCKVILERRDGGW
jgi:hypothetical protein